MDAAFNQFRATIQGHEFYSDPVTKQDLCRHPDHKGAWDPNCWKAAATGFFVEQNPDFRAGETQHDKAQDMANQIDEGSMLVKYVFIAEALDTAGNRAMLTAHTEGIATWDELGLLEWAKQLTVSQMQGRNG